MKNYKTAWCTLFITMCLPLFIQDNVGTWLCWGFFLSTVVFLRSFVTSDMPKELTSRKTYDRSDDDTGNDPIYSYLATNLWHRSSND